MAMDAASADDLLYPLTQDAMASQFVTTMIHHPPRVTAPSSSTARPQNAHQHDNRRSSNASTGVASERPVHHHGSQQQLAQATPPQRMQHVDGNIVLARLQEFRIFLAEFSHQTAPAIDIRVQRIEAMVAEHLCRTERAQLEHERRVGERVDSMSRNVRAACAFSEEDNHERDAALAKSVSEAVVSAIMPRFDSVDCRLDETVTMTRGLQTSVKSFDARLKKLENQVSSSRTSTTSVNNSSSSTPHLARAEVPLNSSCDLDELRYELDLLSKLVESTRREAHLDKEALSLAVSDKHREIASTLHNEFRALKSAVGIGKGSLRSSGLSSISLVERLDSLSADMQAVVEHLKEYEVSRPRNDQPSTELKEGLEQLARLAEAWSTPKKDRMLHDAPVMTDVGEEVNTADNRSQSVPVQAFSMAGVSNPDARTLQVISAQNEDVRMNDATDGSTTLHSQALRTEPGSASTSVSIGSVASSQTPPRAPTNETVPVISPPPGSTTVGSDSSTNSTSIASADVNLAPISSSTVLFLHQPLSSSPASTLTSAPAFSGQSTPAVDTNVDTVRNVSTHSVPNEQIENTQHAEVGRSQPSIVPISPPPSASIGPRRNELQEAPLPSSSASMAPTTEQREQPSHAKKAPQAIDPAMTLISPPPSSLPASRSASPSPASRQRRDAVDRSEVLTAENGNENERSPVNVRPTFAELDRDEDRDQDLRLDGAHGDDYMFNNSTPVPMSPVGPPAMKVVHVIDQERPPSPLTSLSSEDEDERESDDESSPPPATPPDRDQESPSRNRTSSSDSVSNNVHAKSGKSGARSESNRTGPLPCPNGCGKVYTLKDSLRKHLWRDCPLVESEAPSVRRQSRALSASARPTKKRKGAEERPRASSDESEGENREESEDGSSPPPSVIPTQESSTRSSSAVPLQVICLKQKNSSAKTKAKRTGPLPCPNGCGKVYSLRDSLNQHLKFRCPPAERERETPTARRPGHAPSASARPAKRRKVVDEGDNETPRASSSKGTTPSEKKKEKDRRGGPRKPTTTGGKKQPKVITHVHPPEVLQDADWPPKSMVNEMFDHQLLQCDRCDTSYHYRCVGVKKGDSRLEPDAPFICPPCTYINDPQATINKQNGSCCGRPNCDWPGEACDDDSDYFVVERILGRRLANTNGRSESVYKWLVKWSGYPISECDWLEETGLPDAGKLISKYYADAAAQGMSLRDDDKVYLLKEAHRKLHEAMQKKWKWIL